ncbi:hypothetical protein K469DRAFT_668305 [Zopfia rhizophila CBS 207.26]|uniref:Uncharacterized protein n=1 Tax=Zopfia rhizophila CBS 207.26 TaxID=1314779 RepID=A0A6A6E060_9PEZI|nr:hypothetical protein K469DRAFT_668305 [Zopfia rhizophila CBS 207.26]
MTFTPVHLVTEYTALMNAAEQGNRAIRQLLIESGADINRKNKYGRIALHVAVTSRN